MRKKETVSHPTNFLWLFFFFQERILWFALVPHLKSREKCHFVIYRMQKLFFASGNTWNEKSSPWAGVKFVLHDCVPEGRIGYSPKRLSSNSIKCESTSTSKLLSRLITADRPISAADNGSLENGTADRPDAAPTYIILNWPSPPPFHVGFELLQQPVFNFFFIHSFLLFIGKLILFKF